MLLFGLWARMSDAEGLLRITRVLRELDATQASARVSGISERD